MQNVTNTVRKTPSSLTTLPTSDRPKVFFVGDNRSTVNWGRGASLALGQLLSHSFEIVGRVTGDFFVLATAEVGYVGTFMPAKYYAALSANANSRAATVCMVHQT